MKGLEPNKFYAEVLFFPEGNGEDGADAICVSWFRTSPRGEPISRKMILIDGGFADQAQQIIDYIKSKGGSTLELVVNTHPDQDHYSGLSKVFKDKAISVKAFSAHKPCGYEGLKSHFPEGPEREKMKKYGLDGMCDLFSAISKRLGDIKSPFVKLYDDAEVRVDVLGPTEDDYVELFRNFRGVSGIDESQEKAFSEVKPEDEFKSSSGADKSAKNASSMVLKFTFKAANNKIAILTADATVESLDKALKEVPTEDRERTVLFQLPHHGSIHNIREHQIRGLFAGRLQKKVHGIPLGKCYAVASISETAAKNAPENCVKKCFEKYSVDHVSTAGKLCGIRISKEAVARYI